MGEQEYEEEDTWESFEVNRQGDDVYFSLSNRDGEVYGLTFSPEDASAIGMALVQAGMEPEEPEALPEMEVREVGGYTMAVHAEGRCQGDNCPIHNPSDHRLKDAHLHWRTDRGLMERICSHGIGHPDPDDIEYKRLCWGEEIAGAEAVHGCDGCCA